MDMNNLPDENPDQEFERLVQEAKSGTQPSWDKGDVLLNCVCLIVTVSLSVALAPFSFFLIVFVLGPLGGVILAFGGSSANQQVGRSILLGCFLGFISCGRSLTMVNCVCALSSPMLVSRRVGFGRVSIGPDSDGPALR
ncbi:hypothetical protein IAD21_02083 [Abditibacteriota bacterium]|nr:hypothetical protein IAD21_02083 [Abditibacteriota bacterium]